MIKKGDQVYIRPEYVDFVNPIVGEGDIVNYRPWEVTDVFEETIYTGMGDRDAKVMSCNIRQENRTLRAVRQAYLFTTEDRRQARLDGLDILFESEG